MQIRVLFTNHTLDYRSGTELYVRDVAFSLMRRGISVAGYSPRLGTVADELRREGMAVADRLEDLPFTPDIIHGHHHMEVMKALLQAELKTLQDTLTFRLRSRVLGNPVLGKLVSVLSRILRRPS